MLQTINHTTREELGITPLAWLVIDALWQLRDQNLQRREISAAIGISDSQMGSCIKELEGAELYDAATGGFSLQWVGLHSPTAKADVNGLKARAEAVIEVLKDTTGRRFECTSEFIDNLRAIVRALPAKDTGHKQFHGVIMWAHATWKGEYADKVRPQTLFRSPKQYARYLELARTYWAALAKDNPVTE